MLNRDQLLIDLKGAARLGHPEALDLALSALDGWGAFVANARLREEDVLNILVPLGEVLAAPSVPEAYLLALAEHRLAGARALAAAALGLRALRGPAVPRQALSRLGRDRRDEVRWALQAVWRRAGKDNPQQLAALLESWLDCSASPRLQVLALESVAALPPRQGVALLARCGTAADEHVQAALAAALREAAAAGEAEAVLGLLDAWARTDSPPAKAIVAALRGKWAAKTDRQRALVVLTALERRLGTSRALRRARQALEQET